MAVFYACVGLVLCVWSLSVLPARAQEPRSVRLSASQGTVDPPPLDEHVVTFFRLDIDGPLTIPAPTGPVTHGRRLLFILRTKDAQVRQPVTFVDTGYAPQKPAYPLPRCTRGQGESDFLLFRYDGASQHWLLRPPSIAPETPPPEECLAPAVPAGR